MPTKKSIATKTTKVATKTTQAASSATKASLLRDVYAALDDDAPRLVLADLLSQEGDPQGELIVVQCALAKLADNDPHRPQLLKRERAVLRDPKIKAAETALRQRYAIEILAWRRGFISDVEIVADWIVKSGTAIFADTPTIDSLKTNCFVCFAKALPEFARLRRIDIGLGRSEHVPHIDLPLLAGVSEVKLHGASLDVAVSEVCKWRHLKPRVLDLQKTSIRDKGAHILAEAKLDLDRLDLRTNHIGPPGRAALERVYQKRVMF